MPKPSGLEEVRGNPVRAALWLILHSKPWTEAAFRSNSSLLAAALKSSPLLLHVSLH